ncbi:glycoside hydrolase [Erythrobacter sp. QSSC1-22B]|uniref:glycosyltransferase n=1 Tax=Erythrobacter sp. QSSC1-22B TaxID=1860125 RepID=UPI000804AFB9|nr:glycosyltransferase [Erythrobacter sp. QSSC1-22B]OBX18634.1 glycoside hydrolase [Erythrobacter sp. QSSC1-22B]
MPRVLSLSTLYPNAAQPRFGTFVARSLEALQRKPEWDVTVINPIGVPPLALGHYRSRVAAAVDGVEHGVPVHRPTFRLLPSVGGRFNPGAIARAVLPLAKRLHRKTPFDLIDAQFFYPDGPAAMRVAKALGLPLSIKARGADIHYWGTKSYARAAMLEAGNNATGLLAVCEALADDMAALGLPREKIAIHYTGLDRDRFRPLDHTRLRPRLAQELDLPLGFAEPLLVSVGALIPRKGQELVIRALPGLPDARLLLVGKGEDEATLRSLADELGVAGRVHFLGLLDHDLLPLVLSAADAMVLPSASEGLANAWVEALACGTPLVITDVGGARELMGDPVAGVLVARETQAVREGIARVLAEPRHRQAVADTVEGFGWAQNADRLAAHYDRLLATVG